MGTGEKEGRFKDGWAALGHFTDGTVKVQRSRAASPGPMAWDSCRVALALQPVSLFLPCEHLSVSQLQMVLSLTRDVGR